MLFVVGALLCGFASTPEILIGARIVFGFAMSAGPLIWKLYSEIQPLKGRDFGIACSTVTNWIADMIVGAAFLTLLNHIGHARTFWLYAGLCSQHRILLETETHQAHESSRLVGAEGIEPPTLSV